MLLKHTNAFLNSQEDIFINFPSFINVIFYNKRGIFNLGLLCKKSVFTQCNKRKKYESLGHITGVYYYNLTTQIPRDGCI